MTGNGITRDKELLALALHVERHPGDDGPRYIAKRVGEAALAGDRVGVDLWKAVAERWGQLRLPKNHILVSEKTRSTITPRLRGARTSKGFGSYIQLTH